ncbi:hypothetical protein BC831DRAFT_460016, partial [Entophlyctis helioformis]
THRHVRSASLSCWTRRETAKWRCGCWAGMRQQRHHRCLSTARHGRVGAVLHAS